MNFVGILHVEDFRLVTRAHLIAWRKEIERRGAARSTIRRKLAAVASLFNHLCESNAVLLNPVHGVKRPKAATSEGATPAIGDHQARALLEAPSPDNIKGLRDRAILSVLLYHGLRREGLCALKISDIHDRRGVRHLRVHGKGGKTRFLPLHPGALERIAAYMEAAMIEQVPSEPLFRRVRKSVPPRALTADGVYKSVVCHYAADAGIQIAGFGPHALRATAATNALENGSDITKVQEWLGHANIATTKIYDRRTSRPEDSPTFKVRY